jgi:LacI family transcriptional regulator, gluconate utilization system Gnt-I transcriptional repressor
MEDVAREAGVSMITVSRALRRPDMLARATLQSVRAAIARLHYVPNLNAGSLASNRSRIVAVIVPTVSNSIFSDTIDGLSRTVSPHAYQLLLGQTHYRPQAEAALVDAFLGRRVDGLVMTGVKHARGVRARLERADIPVVETWDLTARPIDRVVGFSNHGAGQAAARYLLDKGYRPIAFIGGDDDRSTARLAGVRDVAGPNVDAALVPAPSSPQEGADALGRLLAKGRPRAVFCSNDMLAVGALFECQRRKLRVPADVAIMGFADLPIASTVEPTLTTVQVRSTAMGERAGRLLLDCLDGQAPAERIVDLGFAVVERASA